MIITLDTMFLFFFFMARTFIYGTEENYGISMNMNIMGMLGDSNRMWGPSFAGVFKSRERKSYWGNRVDMQR